MKKNSTDMVRLFRPIFANLLMRLAEKFKSILLNHIQDLATASVAAAFTTNSFVNESKHQHQNSNNEHYIRSFYEKML